MATEFTVADVLAWARTKPADEAYRYSNGVWSAERGGCALCHFLRDTGRASRPVVSPNGAGIDGEWRDGFSDDRKTYPGALEGPLQAGTFGGLVEQLEALCPDTPITKSNWSAIDAYLSDIEAVQA